MEVKEKTKNKKRWKVKNNNNMFIAIKIFSLFRAKKFEVSFFKYYLHSENSI